MNINSLRTRVSLYLLVLVSLSGGVAYYFSSTFIDLQFSRWQQHHRQESLDRASLYLASQQQALTTMTNDYAAWLDTWSFMVQGGQDYLNENYTNESLENLNVNLVFFIDRAHRLTLSLKHDASRVVPLNDLSIWQSISTALEAYWPQGAMGGNLTLWLDGTPLMLAVEPIWNGEDRATQNGWLAMGRLMDQRNLDRLQTMLKSEIRFFHATDSHDEALPVGALQSMGAPSSVHFAVKDELSLSKESQLAKRVLVGNVLTLVIISFLVVAFLFDRMVMRRLSRFSQLAMHPRSLLDETQLWPVEGKDELDNLASSLNDMVNQLKLSQKSLFNEARRDPLTRLGNRTLLLELVERYSPLLCRHHHLDLALLLIDLDEFKVINDSLGHERGDRVLVCVAERLTALARGADVLFRLGGDEFAVLSILPRGSQAAERLARRILSGLSRALDVDGIQVQLSASIGIAYNHGQLDSNDLIRNADLAMYEAKRHGKHGIQAYSDSLHQNISNRLHMEHKLRQAIADCQLEVWYQPIIDVRTQRVDMVEALARWPTEEGYVMPNDFIPLAEDTGLIVPLGYQIAQKAMADLPALRAVNPDLKLNINLSVLQLMQTTLVERLCQLSDANNLPRDAVHFELTESLFAEKNEVLVQHLCQLTEAGFKVHLDDFGTGYSSLERLLNLPVDTLKLDRSFTQTLERGDERLVRAILWISREMKLEVIAEGVETDKEMSRLLALGCHLMQGYLFARPMKLKAMMVWMEERQRQSHETHPRPTPSLPHPEV
ncbi:putative bifunctional diguanylate cyclase/phosphodiesterase [Aeromonas diversa]|uniref:putative bifunctional diguanylate cyclase/phosphodiesterase n=1 Tax=Aeromonas diversa TaxID=502790 RepID=UPI0009D99284|nr:EAL domain-containing protein [Aeromonas diversa]